MEAKYREQLETAMLRYEELDSENRKLRSLKYELDTRVRQQPTDCRSKISLRLMGSRLHRVEIFLGFSPQTLDDLARSSARPLYVRNWHTWLITRKEVTRGAKAHIYFMSHCTSKTN